MGAEGETISGHLMAPGYRDWVAYGLDEIWEMVRHEDGRVNWSQYYGWRRMAQLCEEEADQLEKAVNKLVQLWPDHPGSAAEAFKAFVGGLVESMRETGAAATVNADALYGLTAKLLAAKAEIAALLQERLTYAQAEQQMIEYTRAVTRLPGQPIQAPPPEPERPPDNWWDALDRRARNIMAETDAAIATDAARFRPPKPFRPEVHQTVGSPHIGEASNSTPPIPYPTLDAPQPPLGRVSEPNDIPGRSPVLDGTPSPPTPSTGGQSGPLGYVADKPVSSITTPGPQAAVLTPSSLISRPTQPPLAERPQSPQTRSSQTALVAGRPASGAVSSVPAVIPPTMASRPNSMSGSMLPLGGRAASAYGRRRRDPDDPWATMEGVPAVLEPQSAPPEHDPGPGVIGIDR